MVDASDLSVDDLARRCADEDHNFRARQANNPRYCFELMRRAIQDRSSEALTHIYRLYEPQVTNWVYSHRRFPQTGEAAGYFASVAISNFYFALRDDRFDRFAELPQVLAYLKLCVHTAIMQYLREQRPAWIVGFDEVTEPASTTDIRDLTAQVQTAELWDHICRLLPDESDRLVAEFAFVQGLKPAQIVTDPRAPWKSEREVSVALQRIRRTLRKNAELRQWAG